LSERSCAGVTVKAKKDIDTVDEVAQHLLQQPNPQLQQVHDPDDSHVMYPRSSRTLRPHFLVALQMSASARHFKKSLFTSYKPAISHEK